MKLSEFSFRDLYRQCVILKGERVYAEVQRFLTELSYEAPPDMDAALCYCYIDSMAGMSFHFLCVANYETGGIDEKCYEKILKDKVVLMFRADPDFEINIYAEETSLFSSRMNMVEEGYHADASLLATRDLVEIDHLREKCFPDDIIVFLIKDGIEPERPWVRLCEFEGEELFGILLNEPFRDFGLHAGDRVHVKLGTYEDRILAFIDIK